MNCSESMNRGNFRKSVFSSHTPKNAVRFHQIAALTNIAEMVEMK